MTDQQHPPCTVCGHAARHVLTNVWRCDECGGPCWAAYDPETGEVYVEQHERELWALDRLDMAERRKLIYYIREHRGGGPDPAGPAAAAAA